MTTTYTNAGVDSRAADWRGNSRELLRELPILARNDLGRQIAELQFRRRPMSVKPIHGCTGNDILELVYNRHGNIHWRVAYTVQKDVVYILHVFQKTSNKTKVQDTDVIRRRYREVKAMN